MGTGEIITAIGGSAALFGAMAWLARSVITHVLSRDLEKFKTNLQAETQQELIRLQSSLQLVEFEHQVRFSRLHERQVDIVSEMYSRLVLLHRTASTFVRYYHSVDAQTKNEHVRQLWDAADKFNDYFEKHRIYFAKDVCSKIQGLNSKLSEACSQLVFFFQEAAAIKVTEDQIWEIWNKGMETIESEVPKIKELLEQSFRELLGVLQPTKTGNT
jgi:hypothetical protein